MPGAALRFIARLCRSEVAAGELTRSVGIRMAPTCPAVCAPGSESAPLAGSCGRVTCRLQAAARHLPKRQRSWLDTAAPAPQAPCTHRPSLFSSFPPPPRLSPSSLSSPFFSPSPPLSCILFFRKQTPGAPSGRRVFPSSRTLPLPGGGDRGYCSPLLLSFLPRSSSSSQDCEHGCNAQAACWRPKPARLLSMPSCLAGALLCSRVRAPPAFCAWGGGGGCRRNPASGEPRGLLDASLRPHVPPACVALALQGQISVGQLVLLSKLLCLDSLEGLKESRFLDTTYGCKNPGSVTINDTVENLSLVSSLMPFFFSPFLNFFLSFFFS